MAEIITLWIISGALALWIAGRRIIEHMKTSPLAHSKEHVYAASVLLVIISLLFGPRSLALAIYGKTRKPRSGGKE